MVNGIWFKVKVATMAGKVCTVTPVQANFPLTVVKAMLHYQFKGEGIPPPPQQRLIFNGHVLEDGLTLEDYGIEHNSILQLVMIEEIKTPSTESIE